MTQKGKPSLPENCGTTEEKGKTLVRASEIIFVGVSFLRKKIRK
jgi:hypothetical protein